MFQVGQRVICVKESKPSRRYGDEHMPCKWQIYTVRAAGIHSHTGVPIVRLVEIVNARRLYDFGMCEPSFKAAAFRPIADTDIDIFRQFLETPSPWAVAQNSALTAAPGQRRADQGVST